MGLIIILSPGHGVSILDIIPGTVGALDLDIAGVGSISDSDTAGTIGMADGGDLPFIIRLIVDGVMVITHTVATMETM
jgi:hypothetical protein